MTPARTSTLAWASDPPVREVREADHRKDVTDARPQAERVTARRWVGLPLLRVER